jgi:DNA-binding IclR family transcriptional regulator
MARRWRKDSEFGPGMRLPMDREQRAVWRARLRLWRRPRGLTLGAVAVGQALLGLLGQDGRLDPSVATLAALARVSAGTAHDALRRLREAGFVIWVRRLTRVGWQAHQISNSYALTVPGVENRPLAHDSRKQRGVHSNLIQKRPIGVRQQDEEARESAIRQLQALGMPLPAGW